MSQRDHSPPIALDHFDEASLIRTLIDAVPDPFFFKDRHGRYLLSNRANGLLFGIAPGAEIGKTVFDMPGLREHAEAYHADDQAVVETGEAVINREEPFVRPDGAAGWFLTSKYPIKDSDGQVIGIVGIARDITKRREAERKLNEEQQMLRTLIDGIPDPLFFKDREGRHLLFNRANAELFGFQDKDYIGKTVFEMPIPVDLARLYARDDEFVIANGVPVINREEPYQTEKTNGWFLTSKFPLRDGAGNITGLVGICRDISLRREAERKLNEERQFLQTLIDAIPDLIFFKDREGRHLHLNAADRKVFGVGDSHVGKTVMEWPIPKELAETYAQDDRRVIETGEAIYNKEEPLVRLDGTRGWLLTTKLPLRDEKGEIIGLVGIARDITQMKIDREELERTRQRIVDHVENSPLAIIEWQPDFHIQRWAGRSQDIFGWSAEEVEGRHFFDWPFVHPDDAASVAVVGTQLMSGACQRNVSHNRNLNKKGDVVHCVWQNSALRDRDGHIVSILSLVQDVTEQVRAEETARRAEAERAMIERKLQEAQKLESLGLLAGGIAHDFNNLLTSVIGNASLAATETSAGTTVATCLEQIQAAATRAADLCQQMLAYSGRGRFVVRRVELNQLITETTSLIHASISKGASLGFNLSPLIPVVMADETQMRQVVMNLVINASEALCESSGAIRISTGVMHVTRGWLARAHLAPDLPEGDYVFLEVADTGCGMSPELRARIFDPFFTTKFTGRGLGLAAVLGIVRGHGGALRMESEMGRGSTFRAVFPKLADQEDSPSSSNPFQPSLRGSGTVMIVDDEATVRLVINRMLKALGFDVRVAVDGLDGVRQFAEAPKDVRLVLLDLTMPHLDGEAAFREIRKLNPEARVVLMSGFNEQEVVSQFGSTGLAGFLQKPFTLEMLEEMIRRVLD